MPTYVLSTCHLLKLKVARSALTTLATPHLPPPPDYEERLEELRASRRASRSISGKAGLAEYCIVRRTHFIYERATRKFR